MSTKSTLKKYIPIVRLWGNYNKLSLLSDVIAGITVGLTMIPQSIAYAALAGLTPQYGLNSAFIGCFAYAVFGTVKEVFIGPTAMMSLLTASYTNHLNVHFVGVLTLLSGLVAVLFALLKLGFLMDFISAPVICGFVSAVAIIVGTTQLKYILGIAGKSSGFIGSVKLIANNLGQIRLSGDLILGVTCIIVLLLMKELKDVKLRTKRKSRLEKAKAEIVNKIIWFISTSRNAIVVIVCMIVTACFQKYCTHIPFTLTGAVDSGISSFKIPNLNTTISNSTYTFTDMAMEIKTGIIIVPLIAVIENIAIGKAFSKSKSVEAQQEMIALGICNMLGACFGAMPTCGAISRSAVASSSGVRSPLSSLFSGLLVLLSISFLNPFFHLIPRATLSAVLICAVINLIEWHLLLEMWPIKKFDFALTIITLFISLIMGVEVGLISGVAINSLYLLHLWQATKVSFQIEQIGEDQYYLLVVPDRGLYFPAIDSLRNGILKKIEDGHNSRTDLIAVAIDCQHFIGLDFTCVKELCALVSELEKSGRGMHFIVNSNSSNRDIIDQLMQGYSGTESNPTLICTSRKHLESVIRGSIRFAQPIIHRGHEGEAEKNRSEEAVSMIETITSKPEVV
ncbi:sodium-independent sulfate anion transporter isoform X2 [Nilaparvata lugens]|uniref:sodium-independent sulfate anion transporter isoform X2 n=1 Tax=Nilaparvata lugens TaxID=108931 RepID=UPI00193D8E99|nr:sodium-independent sulfate anion transporter isoform X2 [Nilaparvata lugens]